MFNLLFVSYHSFRHIRRLEQKRQKRANRQDHLIIGPNTAHKTLFEVS